MSQIIIAILLYLGIISSPNTYHLTQLKAYENQYTVQINDVMSDPAQMQIVQRDYLPLGDEIIIIDDTQW